MLLLSQQHRQTPARLISTYDLASSGPPVLLIGLVIAGWSPHPATLFVPLVAVPPSPPPPFPPPPVLLCCCRALLCWWHSIQPEPPNAQGREWGAHDWGGVLLAHEHPSLAGCRDSLGGVIVGGCDVGSHSPSLTGTGAPGVCLGRSSQCVLTGTAVECPLGSQQPASQPTF